MKPEDKLAAIIALLMGSVLFLCLSCAHADDQWQIDGTTGLHAGISFAMGYTVNSAMIAAEGRNAVNDNARPYVAMGLCMVPGIAKEYAMDAYPSYTDLLADLAGCGFGVWLSDEMWVTVDNNVVALHGRW